jgi:chitinase
MRWKFLNFSLAAILSCSLAVLSLFPQQARALAFFTRSEKTTARPLLVGYFPQWGLYDDQPYLVKDLLANGGIRLLDQINYAQAFVTGGRCSIADPNADLGNAFSAANSVSGIADDPASNFRGYFHQLQELKGRYPQIRILISLEGKASSFADDAKPENRQAFVASCVDRFLRGDFAPGIHAAGIFDGFDIDWEYPQQQDADNYRALLQEFRRQMNATQPGSRLSVAVGPAPGMMPGTDFRAIASLVDQVGVMNYDYTGPWNPTTGFLAPLFDATGPGPSESIARSMEHYEAAGVPARKLLMGVPFYGYSWTAVGSINNGLFQSGHGVRGDRPYSYIRTLAGQFSVHRDPLSHAEWLFDGQTFWTFDDPVSVRYKASYAAREHLGGVMVWELAEDTRDAELLHVARRALEHPLGNKSIGAEPAPALQSARTRPAAAAANPAESFAP